MLMASHWSTFSHMLIHLLTLTSQHVSENALMSHHIISFFMFHKNNSASHTTPGTLITVWKCIIIILCQPHTIIYSNIICSKLHPNNMNFSNLKCNKVSLEKWILPDIQATKYIKHKYKIQIMLHYVDISILQLHYANKN